MTEACATEGKAKMQVGKIISVVVIACDLIIVV